MQKLRNNSLNSKVSRCNVNGTDWLNEHLQTTINSTAIANFSRRVQTEFLHLVRFQTNACKVKYE